MFENFFSLLSSSSSPSAAAATMSSRASSPLNHVSGQDTPKETDSGYVSGSGSDDGLPELHFTKSHLKFLNQQLQNLEPQEVIRWCLSTLPRLFQSTAFGLTGLVTLDMLSKMEIPRPQMVDQIFLDTFHHFPETLSLVDKVQGKYPNVTIHRYSPLNVRSAEEFAETFGEKLWERDDELYDWTAKVEPAQRAYRDLHVNAILTGRRRTQGGQRGDLDIIEIDEAGLVKINPLANWSLGQIWQYIKDHDVPYNELLDRGYKSVGDWHSTQPVGRDEDERAGRWKGQEKTECGIHNPRSRYAQLLMEANKAKEQEALTHALQEISSQA